MSDSTTDYSDLWAVHSEKEERPALCDWAPNEADANKKLADLQASDPDTDTRYWVTRMTTNEVESFKASGFIPADA